MATKEMERSRTAVFIDAENQPDLILGTLMQLLNQLDVVERHVYADWRNHRLDHLVEKLYDLGFELHYTWSGPKLGDRKNEADQQMAKGIQRVVERDPHIETIVIISGDHFFTRTVQRLRQSGKYVIVAAIPRRVSKTLCNAADRYLPLGKVARWIQSLDQAENTSQYMTFRFAVQKSGVRPFNLEALIQQGIVIQERRTNPQWGERREIYLNREAYAVQATLGFAA